MIVDHAHKYVFVSIPKTGSISIQFSLGYGHDIPEPALYHCSLTKILEQYPEALAYKKCAFVRNPWARLLSLYKDFTLKRGHQYSALVRHDQPLFSEFANFEDFCVRVKDTPWWNDVFLCSQSRLLGDHELDFIGCFENFQSEFERLCDFLGIGLVPLQQMNLGVYDKTSYRTAYTTTARTAVALAYADDVERFGYEF